MKVQTHISLFLKTNIENWQYVDTILFLIILLMFVGFTDPCERCAVNFGNQQMTCKQAFLDRIGYEENDLGMIVKQQPLNLTNKNITILNFSKV